MGAELSLVWTAPFVGILLSIALFPLFAPHFWHHHFKKISIGWGALFAVPFLLVYREHAWHEIVHIFALDYVPFLILLWSLFTVSGGILLRGSLAGTPLVNGVLILIGTALASFIGTTGASMLLIRPLLRANERRRHKAHTVVFFIFLVSNIGGALTPLGDPPLFLGFLHGVPFFWTMTHLFLPMIVATGVVLATYVALDAFFYARESLEAKAPALQEPLRLDGARNFLFLGGILVGVLLSGYWKPTHISHSPWIEDGKLLLLSDASVDHAEPVRFETHAAPEAHSAEPLHAEAHESHEHGGVGVPVENLARDGILIAMGLLSLLATPRTIRSANGFSWFPIVEVAWLFAGIFMTIIPALAILKAGESGQLAGLVRAVQDPWHYFWATGILSSFLDNAPTYLTFFNTALGRFAPGLAEPDAVRLLIEKHGEYLAAISAGAVFMGANTYIGNAPNFMVRSIAEESGVRMPDFFSYLLKYSLPVLGATFALITFLFFLG